MKFIFLGLLLITTLTANSFFSFDADDTNNSVNSNDVNQEEYDYYPQKVLYLSYQEIPTRVLKGEIFSVTIKTLSTIEDSTDIQYKLTNFQGVKPLNEIPYTTDDSKYFYDTFYFLTTSSKAKLPDFTATLDTEEEILYKPTTIAGQKLNVVTLNPKDDFSNIIADSFELVDFKTSSYDEQSNILVFVAKAKNCDIKSLNLNGPVKQGIESAKESYFDSKITYYAVINKDIENFSFSYFNLSVNKFLLINIPIVVEDDSVTTQSDIKPKDHSREKLKMVIVASFALIVGLFLLWRELYIYLVFLILPIAYIVYLAIPSKEICIKQGSDIHLLPVHNGTIFDTTHTRIFLKKEGSAKEFIKVKLNNNKIGWIKNEDICSY